jgi:hypothetical protein
MTSSKERIRDYWRRHRTGPVPEARAFWVVVHKLQLQGK